MRKITVILFITLILCLAGLFLGSASISFEAVMGAIFGGSGTAAVIVRTLRLPRVLGAVLSGCALAVSGLLLQTVTGNDLCSPNVVGANAGAGLGVMLVLALFPAAYALLPAAAFIGSIGAVLLVLGIADTAKGHRRSATMLLAGIAVSSLLNACISYLSQRYPDALPSYAYFSAGGFTSVRLGDLPLPAAIIGVCLAASFLLTPRLNLLTLGEDQAASLGVHVRLLRGLSLILAGALCAASVTYAGLLGFVGLIVPHMTRRFMGSDLRLLMPAAALSGASLVLLADLVGRTLFAPAEISAGIFLAMIGAPFFLMLLYRRR